MKKTTLALVAILGLAALVVARPRAGAKPEAVTLNPTDVKFGPAPPVLPRGAQVAVLHGDPSQKGPYAMRLKLPDGYKVAPHWHTNDEELTIIGGTFLLSMGDRPGEDLHTLTAGSYHFLPGKMHHAAEARGETVVEIHSNGPFDLHYLNPADDPSRAAAATKK